MSTDPSSHQFERPTTSSLSSSSSSNNINNNSGGYLIEKNNFTGHQFNYAYRSHSNTIYDQDQNQQEQHHQVTFKANNLELNSKQPNEAQKNLDFLNICVNPINSKDNINESTRTRRTTTSSFTQYSSSNSQQLKIPNSGSVSSDSTSSLSPTTLSESHSSTNNSPLGSSPDSKLTSIHAKEATNIFAPILESIQNTFEILSSESEEELKPLDTKNSNTNRNEIVYTPDSLESSSSTSSSLSNLYDNKALTNFPALQPASRQVIGNDIDDLEADEEIQQINNKSKESQNAQQALATTTESSKISDTSLILEKIKKINQLQEKINDINNKIKSIDMSDKTQNSETHSSNRNYYMLHAESPEIADQQAASKSPTSSKILDTDDNSIRYYINPKYCGDDDLSDEESKRQQYEENVSGDSLSEADVDDVVEDVDDEEEREDYDNNQTYMRNLEKFNQRAGDDYRSANNQTRLGVRAKTVEEKNNEIFENISHTVYRNSLRGAPAANENDNDNRYFVEDGIGKTEELYDSFNEDQEFYGEEEEEDDDFFLNGSYVINGTFYKQAQPVHKKFASTGFLCNRFGSFLAPIEESQDEPPLQLDKGLNILKTVSSSCYDLVYEQLNKKTTQSSMNHDQLSEEIDQLTTTEPELLAYSQTSVINNANQTLSEIVEFSSDNLIMSNTTTTTTTTNHINHLLTSVTPVELLTATAKISIEHNAAGVEYMNEPAHSVLNQTQIGTMQFNAFSSYTGRGTWLGWNHHVISPMLGV